CGHARQGEQRCEARSLSHGRSLYVSRLATVNPLHRARAYTRRQTSSPGFVMSRSGLCVAYVAAASLTAPVAAHHSYVEFDQQNTIEIEGTLVAAAWQNPHTRLTVAGADGARWDIESSAVN